MPFLTENTTFYIVLIFGFGAMSIQCTVLMYSIGGILTKSDVL